MSTLLALREDQDYRPGIEMAPSAVNAEGQVSGAGADGARGDRLSLPAEGLAPPRPAHPRVNTRRRGTLGLPTPLRAYLAETMRRPPGREADGRIPPTRRSPSAHPPLVFRGGHAPPPDPLSEPPPPASDRRTAPTRSQGYLPGLDSRVTTERAGARAREGVRSCLR